MVERITDRLLYHVTADKPYKRAFFQGQTVCVGEGFNPFFGFYEGPREYPVTQPDGSVLKIKAVSFLKQVKDGAISCPQLASIAAEVVQHYVMLARELLMEDIRLKNFPDAPSRQKCLYLCETLEEARHWNDRIGDGGWICLLRCTGVIHRADASLLLGDSEPLTVTKTRAERYWRGEANEPPEWETLFFGDAVVIAIGL